MYQGWKQIVVAMLVLSGAVAVAEASSIESINAVIAKNTYKNLASYPASMTAEEIHKERYHYRMNRELYLEGRPIGDRGDIIWNDTIGPEPATYQVGYGVVTSPSNMRSFPVWQGVYASPRDTRSDLWQETKINYGSPVRILQKNIKGNFYLVESEGYRGWLPRNVVGVTDRKQWLQFYRPQQVGVVTATNYLLDDRELCQMGTTLPRSDKATLLPHRNSLGHLVVEQKQLDTSDQWQSGYLPFQEKVIVAQARKYLGLPYDWGGKGNSVDCSALTQNVYRTVGINLPRNTDQQEYCYPGVKLEGLSRSARIQALSKLPLGSLLYMPNHTLIYSGMHGNVPYAIHALGSKGVRLANGRVQKVSVRRVVETPVELLGSSGTTLLMRLTKAISFK